MKKVLSALLISSLVFATSAIAKSSSSSSASITTTSAITTYSLMSHYGSSKIDTGYTSDQMDKLIPDPDSLTGKYNTSSRRNAVEKNETCSAVLSGTIHKGKRMTILKTSEGDLIMEKFFVKEWNQYLYASSFDLSTFECE